ncbi:MAG: phosphatase PAP2 family protein [Alphaproteobacteria bacterium]|nr:phosphatase PAP2 family protein [Alphaproteobacteria bacterium]
MRQLASLAETRVMASLLAASAGAWAFLEIADEVAEGETHAIDRAIFLALRTAGRPDDPLGPGWLEEAMRDLTALGGFTVLALVVIGACGSLFFLRRRRAAGVLLGTALTAQASVELLKLLYERARPDLVPHLSWVTSASFPSGHSALAATVYLTLGVMVASGTPSLRARALVLTLALFVVAAVGVSRVYLGVHWPTDVLAGWALGAAFAMAARLVHGLWRGQGGHGT